jgi:hypothetical protein
VSDDIRSQLAPIVASLVHQEWDERGQPLLLGRLGALLSEKGYSTKRLFPPGELFRFIERIGPTSGIGVYRNSRVPAQIALFPADAVKNPDDSLFDAASHPKRPSYKPNVWEAFITPLKADHHRFIDLTENGSPFVDIPASDDSVDKDGLIQVDDRYLNVGGGYIPPDEVSERIKEWAHSAAVELEHFTVRRSDRPERPNVRVHASTLLTLLDTLNDEQRRSLQLRGDIVYALLVKR